MMWKIVWKRWSKHTFGKDGLTLLEKIMQENLFGKKFTLIPYSLDNEREETTYDLTRIYGADEVTEFERENCIVIEYEGSEEPKVITMNNEEFIKEGLD